MQSATPAPGPIKHDSRRDEEDTPVSSNKSINGGALMIIAAMLLVWSVGFVEGILVHMLMKQEADDQRKIDVLENTATQDKKRIADLEKTMEQASQTIKDMARAAAQNAPAANTEKPAGTGP